jgi:PAS domain S-box-containing protein
MSLTLDDSLQFIAGGGETGACLRAHDWSATALGAIDNWPQCLRTAVSLCLHAPFPAVLWWGPDFTAIFNDSYAEAFAQEPAESMGRSGGALWDERWGPFEPILRSVVETGASSRTLVLLPDRRAPRDAVYFTIANTPVFTENGTIGGVFSMLSESAGPAVEHEPALTGEPVRRPTGIAIPIHQLSHEFRTPLTLVLGPLEQALVDPAVLSTPLQEQLGIAYRNAQRLLELVNQLLTAPDLETAIARTQENGELPAGEAVEKATHPAATSDRPLILLVDDNADMRLYISRLLDGPYEVRTAQNGEEAWAAIRELKPALVLSDVMMPVLDGFGLVERIRSNGHTATLPVILLSARAGEDAVSDGLQRGADDYLAKPFNPVDLRLRVATALQRAAIREQSQNEFGRLVMESRLAMAVLKGRDLTITLANHSMIEILGKGSDILGKRLIDVVPESADQGLLDLLDRVYRTGEATHGFERMLRFVRNGLPEDRYFNFVYQPLRESNGHVSGITVVANEVTPHALANKRIAESEARVRDLFEQAPVSIIILRGEDFVVELVNSGYAEILGRPKADVLGRPLWDVVPEVRHQGFGEFLDEVYRTGKPFLGHQVQARINRNGRVESPYFNFVYYPLREDDGTISGVIAVATDVTDQVLSRQAVARNEERLRLALDLAEIGTWEFNPATGAMICSDRMLELFGFPAGAEVTGEQIMAAVADYDRARVDEAMVKASQPASGGLYEIEYAIINQGDRLPRLIRAKGQGFFDDQGTLTRFVGTAIDVTEQKQAERILREHASQLEQRVRERTVELHHTSAELQRSNSELAQFAYVASHDLREPLRKIVFFGDRLSKQYGHHFEDDASVYLRRMQDAARRMSHMIDDLLEFSQLTAGAMLTDTVDLQVALDKALRHLEPVVRAKKAVVRVPEPLPVIRGHESQWQQCLENLLSNALKFSHPGTPPEIDVRYAWLSPPAGETDGGRRRLQLTIADNGIGFEPEYAERIFGLFQRLHGRSEYDGSGIGLAICKKVVENHRGWIRAEGHPGAGARFIVELPEEEA